jgi:hypothetical protein
MTLRTARVLPRPFGPHAALGGAVAWVAAGGMLKRASAAAPSVTRPAAAAALMASALGVRPEEFAARLVAALAALAQAMGRDLAEADWWRLLDVLLLVAVHPAGRAP